MDKQSIVSKMVIIAEKHNQASMISSGMDAIAIETMSNAVRQQLFTIQEEILDTLVNEGLVSIN